MSAGGGTFVTQNKILPGAYINFVSQARAMSNLGVRGIVALMLILDWGKQGEVITLDATNFQRDSLNLFGYSFTDPKLIYLREVLLGARTLKLYRPIGGNKATVVIGNLTVNALYGGTRGNDIKIVIEADVDEEDYYYVTTLLGNENIEVDRQRVLDIKDLVANNFVSFSGTGELEETAGTNLTGGTNKIPTGINYSDFLEAMEKETFTTIMYAGSDQVTKAMFASFTKRLRDAEGYKITTVLHDYNIADFEGVISVKNVVTDTNPNALVYWVAGASAGAEVSQSLTNIQYIGELEINGRYSNSELTEAITTGQFVFYGDRNNIRVLKDINTFTSFRSDKNSDFSNNQIIRVLDEVANGTARIFDNNYLGIVQNDNMGRNLFKGVLISFYDELQAIRAIENFRAEDISISKGTEKGDVEATVYIEPVGAMDKLYMTVTVV